MTDVPVVSMPSIGDSFAADIAVLETQFDVIRYMRRVLAFYGFGFFTICMVPAFDVDRIADISIVSNLPADVLAQFDERALLQYSAGFRKLRTTTTPFRLSAGEWSEATLSASAESHTKILEQIGVDEAYYFPVHDADGSRAALILLGRQIELPVRRMMELQMIAIHVYNRLTEIGAFWKEEEVVLSEREIQCLDWTAAGKTSAEIAGILGLSEHTVNHYLNHVTKKLNASNRTQAVVKAMRRGLIS